MGHNQTTLATPMRESYQFYQIYNQNQNQTLNLGWIGHQSRVLNRFHVKMLLSGSFSQDTYWVSSTRRRRRRRRRHSR